MGESRIMSNGEAAVWKRPSVVLMQVHLVDSAATIENAMSRLRLRVESAKKLLKQLNASDIAIGPFVLGELEEDDAMGQARIAREAALAARQQTFGRPVRKPTQNDVEVSVYTIAKAQWMIQGDNDEERLISVANLRRSLADIGGVSDEKQEDALPAWPTPEEEIKSIMAKSMANVARLTGQSNRRIPRLYFVTSLDEADESKAFAEAISRARATAERLAQASGKTLGDFANVSHSHSFADHSHVAVQRRMSGDWPRICGSANQVWDDMRAVQFIVQVSVYFHIMPASD